MKTLLLAASLVVVLVSLGGCAISIGTKSDAPPPTLGQQLIDLNKALQKEAITQEDYERAKDRLISQGS
jgi:hypothetical protein